MELSHEPKYDAATIDRLNHAVAGHVVIGIKPQRFTKRGLRFIVPARVQQDPSEGRMGIRIVGVILQVAGGGLDRIMASPQSFQGDGSNVVAVRVFRVDRQTFLRGIQCILPTSLRQVDACLLAEVVRVVGVQPDRFGDRGQ